MPNFAKFPLSGSAHGAMIRVDSASPPGILLHTAVSGTAENQMDEVWLWCTNGSAANLNLTIEWGTNSTGSNIQSIPSKSGALLVVPGLVLRNSEVVRAYGENASGVWIAGFVNRITP